VTRKGLPSGVVESSSVGEDVLDVACIGIENCGDGEAIATGSSSADRCPVRVRGRSEARGVNEVKE
jgi:hypothetical protein